MVNVAIWARVIAYDQLSSDLVVCVHWLHLNLAPSSLSGLRKPLAYFSLSRIYYTHSLFSELSRLTLCFTMVYLDLCVIYLSCDHYYYK